MTASENTLRELVEERFSRLVQPQRLEGISRNTANIAIQSATDAAMQAFTAAVETVIGHDTEPLPADFAKQLKVNGPVYEQFAVVQNMLRKEQRKRLAEMVGKK